MKKAISNGKKIRMGYRKGEFLFNLISLLIMIGIGIYFGVRSFYYYSKQNMKMQEEAQTLNGTVLAANSVVKSGTGLHRDTDGYYFKGTVTNNYVSFMNRMFRIIRIGNDGSVKLISEDLVSQFMWGEDSAYQKSNLYSWLTKSEQEYSGVYYSTFSDVDKFLLKTRYDEAQLIDSKVVSSKNNFKDFITTLTIRDYVNADGKNSYLNIQKYFWILGHDSDEGNLYVDEEGAIQSGSSYESYGVRAVFTLKKNLNITSGNGTRTEPYVVDVSGSQNKVGQVVRLGNDIWRVYQDQNNQLRLVLQNYILENNQEVFMGYSTTTSLFQLKNRRNIGYYLNHNFYSSLSYRDLLQDCVFYTGEVSNDTGLNYQGIYTSHVVAKVGLLNLFDYQVNSSLQDYYFMNTTSTVGSMAYVFKSNGLLEEEKVTEKKHIVPVVCISSDIIKSGTGSDGDPYVVE